MDRQQLDMIRAKNPFTALNDIVYEIQLQEIIHFGLPPGSRLNESKIAGTLGVSRSPVKAALEKLLEKGFLRVQSSRYYVAEFSQKEYKNVTDLAVLLESYAAGEAALNLRPKQINDLYVMAYKLQEHYRKAINKGAATNYRDLLDEEFKFHTYIVRAANNNLVTDIYEDLKYTLFRYRSYLLYSPPSGVFELLENDHIVLCDALKLGDKEVAEASARRHLSISRRVIARSGLMQIIGTDDAAQTE